MDVDQLLKKSNFNTSYALKNRASIADLFRPGKRCGIYVLHFKTGEYYIGKAVDVTRRYIQHCKNHDDIQKISFKRIPRNELKGVEKEDIRRFEKQGFLLRNISLTSLPKGESDFDLILPVEAQNEWLEDLEIVHLDGKRVKDPDLRRKYEKRYANFLKQPQADETISVLRKYVKVGIPAVKSSEISFWSLSCLPSFQKDSEMKVYARLNIFWQEVFSIHFSNNIFNFSFFMARSSLEKKYGTALMNLRWKFPFSITNQRYDVGGVDQINIQVHGVKKALQILKDPGVVAAIRLFNLRLMKKGPCTYSRYHCLPLADHLVGSFSTDKNV